MYLDVLEEGVNGANPLAQAQIEQLGSFVATNVVAIVGDLVRNVPVPAIPGAMLTGATLTTGDAQGGYVLVSGQLR